MGFVDAALPEPEREQMVASAERIAHLHGLRQQVLHEHRRRRLYADEHPEEMPLRAEQGSSAIYSTI